MMEDYENRLPNQSKACSPPFIVSRVKSSGVLVRMSKTPFMLKGELYGNAFSVKELESN